MATHCLASGMCSTGVAPSLACDLSTMASASTPRLTAAGVAALKPPTTGRRYVADGTVPGLQLALSATGARSWVLQYRMPGAGRAGRPQRFTIGDPATLTLADARKEAQRLRSLIASGVEPVGARREKLSRDRDTPRMSELVLRWLEEHIAVKRTEATRRQYERLWRLQARPGLGSLRVPEVSLADVDAVHRRWRATPATANRVVAMLGSFFKWCERHGYRPANSNPTRGIDRYSEEQRERFLTEAEIVRLGAALKLAETNGLPAPARLREKSERKDKAKHRPKTAGVPVPADPFAIAALRFALLSGWRIGEVCRLTWDAIDTAHGVATLAKTKTGRAVRPLGAAALNLLDELPRIDGSPFVFPSARRGFGVTDPQRNSDRSMGVPRRLWEAVRDQAKLDGVRIHDLRHSFGATAADAGQSLIMIASLLGHAQTRTTERYANARRDVRQGAADVVSGNLMALLDGSDQKTVLPLRGAKER